jgi:hypothetical protein
MRMGRRRIGIAAMLALSATVAACGGAGGGGNDAAAAQREVQARADSARNEDKELRDSGVSVDTQTVDTGTAAAPAAEDN